MTIPPYIFDTDDDVLDTLSRVWDISDPAVSIAWITRGGWRADYPDYSDHTWWQDGDTMDVDDFAEFCCSLHEGKWT